MPSVPLKTGVQWEAWVRAKTAASMASALLFMACDNIRAHLEYMQASHSKFCLAALMKSLNPQDKVCDGKLGFQAR